MDSVIGASFVAILAAGIVFGVWALASGVRGDHHKSRDVKDPKGDTWSTRIVWGHPSTEIGLARRVFTRRPKRSSKAIGEPKRERYSDGFFDLVFFLLEGGLVIAGLAAMVFVIVALFLAILLALELVFFLVVVAAVSLGRFVFGHPWMIAVRDPNGEIAYTDVEGLRAARDANREIRRRIAAGEAWNNPLSV
ncbi:MAG: hypothetical protein IH940_14010 [Acidobacteria bacterium]|nr:hypothetical protein [Acidobacteriota bacterium]